jgi:hypothetical protein
MSEKLKTNNLKQAIQSLPNPKNYNADVVSVAVNKITYTFVKTNNEWYFKI